MTRFDAFLKRNSPPGSSYRKVFVFSCVLSLILLLLFGFFSFLIRYSNAVKGLYIADGGLNRLQKGVVMTDINDLTIGLYVVFPAIIVMNIGQAVGNFLSFYSESMSIYTIKRLPSAELFRRCAALPLLIAAVSFAVTILLLNICGAIYMSQTPAECLPASVRIRLFDALMIFGR